MPGPVPNSAPNSELSTDAGRGEKIEIAIIGAGPAGLMAAERLSALGHQVAIFDGMATPGRKFLMAGRGGLNLTHSEPLASFVTRYSGNEGRFRSFLTTFSPADLRTWADGLGAETFIGSSGRIFPRAMKASGLLRVWLARLRGQGVTLHLRHHWLGWDGDTLVFRQADGSRKLVQARATVLALGGGSWPKLGSDGSWLPRLQEKQVPVRPLLASNCGIDIAWSAYFQEHFAGQPLKAVAITIGDQQRRGEIILTRYGLEGGPIYALSPAFRTALQSGSPATTQLDLKPDLSVQQLAERLVARRHGQSLSQFLKKTLHLPAASYALLREAQQFHQEDTIPEDPAALALQLKQLDLPVQAMQPIEQAISSAGGIAFEGLTDQLMLRNIPGVFACGEMLDWEAPTGGYLLQGCFATAVIAAAGVDRFLQA